MDMMIKNFKKFFCTLLALSIGFTFTTIQSKARSISEEDIMQYVISGSGTYDDPYVLSSNNEYKDMFDEMAKEAIQPSISLASDFSGNLTGETRTNQTNGGIWKYKSGGYDVSSDGIMQISSVSYSTFVDASELLAVMNTTSAFNILIQNISIGLAGKGLVTALVNAGFALTRAERMGLIFSVAIAMKEIGDSDKRAVTNAVSQKHGIVTVGYATFYHGSWYASSCIDIWSTYTVNSSGQVLEATVRFPISAYGIGTYTAK